MARLRLFGPARQAAGTAEAMLQATEVGAVIAAATERFGDEFARVVATSQVWLNGEEADMAAPVGADDEVAIIPPVSGG
jgi:molybdopterin converting factor small subunit